MKKNMAVTIFILFVIVLNFSFILLTKTKTVEAKDLSKVSLGESVRITKNSLNIIVDPRLELLSIVQFISDYDKKYNLMTDYDFKFKKEVKEHFSSFKNHEAVKLFNKLSDKGFTFDAPATIMLYMDNNFQLCQDIDVTDYLVSRISGKKNIDKFFRSLQKFCHETEFNNFYNEHKEYYQLLIENVLTKIGEKNYIEELEEYYGVKQKEYNIILVSLFHPGGFGPKIESEKAKYKIYSIQGPNGTNNNMPDFGSEASFRHLARHEFSHSFVNPLADKYWSIAEQYSDLFTPIAESMKIQAYMNWKICLNEHIVRAVTTRLSFLDNEFSGRRMLAYEKSKGFTYIDKLLEALKEYENNRDKYPTFESFYPNLIESFEYYKK